MSVLAGTIYRNFSNDFPHAREGHLRIWWIPQIPGEEFEWPVADLQTAGSVLDMLASYDDFQYEHRVKGDYCNMGGLIVFRDGEWVDWESLDNDQPISLHVNLTLGQIRKARMALIRAGHRPADFKEGK